MVPPFGYSIGVIPQKVYKPSVEWGETTAGGIKLLKIKTVIPVRFSVDIFL